MIALALVGLAQAAVSGPWEQGHYLSVAGDPSLMEVVWLEEETLYSSQSRDLGTSWSEKQRIASHVEAGDGGQIRPELLRPGLVAYVHEGGVVLAERGKQGWSMTRTRSQAPGVGVLFDAALVAGEPVVVWLDTRRDPSTHTSDIYVWQEGVETLAFGDEGDGVCMCCRPAVAEVSGAPVVAFRDADGALREARRLELAAQGWQSELATSGGWSPGGCPGDGPSVDSTGAVWISDARAGERAIYRGDKLIFGAEGVQVIQPRVVGAHRVWVEAVPGKLELVVDGQHLATTKGRMEPGDPIVVGQELLVPWQGEHAQLEVLRLDSE